MTPLETASSNSDTGRYQQQRSMSHATVIAPMIPSSGASGGGGSMTRRSTSSPTVLLRCPAGSGRPTAPDNAAQVLQRVSGHLHKLNQGLGADDPDNDADDTTTISCIAKPIYHLSSQHSRSSRRLPMVRDGSKTSLAHSNQSNKSAPCSPSVRPSASASISTFSALPHHETRIASNRGMYIRHRRLGAGSYGETWLCEWRPLEMASSIAKPRTQSRSRERGGVIGATGGGATPSRSVNNNNKSNSVSSSVCDRSGMNSSGGSTNINGVSATAQAALDDSSAGKHESAAQQKAAVTPPAVVSALSCCTPTVVISKSSGANPHDCSLPADRVFVVKIDTKRPAEIAEEVKNREHMQRIRTDASALSAALVIQHPALPSRQVMAFVPPPLHVLDSRQRQEEDAESFGAAKGSFLHSTQNGAGMCGASEADGHYFVSSASSAQSATSLGSAIHGGGSSTNTAPLGIAGSSRRGGVPVLERKSIQQALRNHTSTVSRESSVLRNCAHPNIVGFVDEFEDATKRYLVMEYVDGGDLQHEVERRAQVERRAAESEQSAGMRSAHFSVSSALFVWVQALCAVEYLHRHNILHRDIKTANLLFSKKWRVLLADFGFGRNYDHDIDEREATITAQGTPHYMAPELFRREPVSGKADIWALGVVLFELLTLKRPFERNNHFSETVRARVTNEPHPPVNSFRPPHLQVPQEVVALIDAMLQKDPAKRPTAKQLMRMQIVSDALDEFLASFKKAAADSPKPIDAVLITMLEEHIKLVRSDELSSPASRRRSAEMRRSMVASRSRSTGGDDDDDDDRPVMSVRRRMLGLRNRSADTSKQRTPQSMRVVYAKPIVSVARPEELDALEEVVFRDLGVFVSDQ